MFLYLLADMKRIITVVPWVCSVLLLVHSTKSLQCEGGEFRNRFCLATSMFPEWCNCDGKTMISLTENGVRDRLENTSIIYYFSNQKAVSVRCSNDRICLCPMRDERNCRRCDASTVSDIMCLKVVNNHLQAADNPPDGTVCNISKVCQNHCRTSTCKVNGITLAPPIGPRVSATTYIKDRLVTDLPKSVIGVEQVAIGAGAGVFVLVVLLIVLIFCCRRNKDANRKKKEGPYEAVYSTIADGSLKNGNVLTAPQMFPNQLYDARVEGGPPIPPSRPGMPSHYKSLPSLLAGDYFSSGNNVQHQPHLPHHQPVWTNGPTLHRYPSTDVITPGYLPYGHDQQAAPGAPYMYLKKKPKQHYQSLSPTVELRPDEMAKFRRLAAKGRPGYKSPTSDSNTWVSDGDPQLNRDPRSLPTDGNPKEVGESRQHATYGFERKGQKPRSSSGKSSSSKPVPAKRGVYRSVGSAKSDRRVNTASSESDDDSYQGCGSEGSPYYFKMTHGPSERPGETGAMVDKNDQNTEPPVDTSVEEQKKKNNPKRKPKPRSRRTRRRPTTEVTCAMTENPLVSYSNDESDVAASEENYTDEDIDEGLTQMDKSSTTEQPLVDDDFEDSDYNPPSTMSR